jgi:hypothetical protein
MLFYPEGMLAMSPQHRQEMLDEAQRWRLVRRVRRTRRNRRTAADGTTDRTNHRARVDAQPDGVARPGHIAGWVAAGGRGRVEIPPNPSTRNDLGPRDQPVHRRPIRKAAA